MNFMKDRKLVIDVRVMVEKLSLDGLNGDNVKVCLVGVVFENSFM